MSINSVQNIFQEVFEDPNLKISLTMTAKDVANWDSFNHINLILALEEAFNVRFTTAEMAHMANVGELVGILAKKGVSVAW